jgi:hypothetical protein
MLNLLEHTVYLRLSSAADLLNDGRILAAIDTLSQTLQTPFSFTQDLGSHRRDLPLSPSPGLSPLFTLQNRGIHPTTKLKILSTASPENTPHIELTAGIHPYSGKYRVSLDLRLQKSWFAQQDAPARFAQMVQNLVLICDPFVVHAHDTDDNTVQNISDPGLLKRAFSANTDDTLPLAERPGREINLGEMRYAVNWITVLGAEQVQTLQSLSDDPDDPLDISKTPAQDVFPLANGRWWVRLYNSPLDAHTPLSRSTQLAVFLHWHLPLLARRQGPSLGYWDRKGRR